MCLGIRGWMWGMLLAACVGPLCAWGEPLSEIRGLLLRFDEPVGRRFTDYSGSGHTVSPNGGVTQSRNDYVGGAGSACFDGTGYLNVNGASDFYFHGDFTIDFWFKSSSDGSAYAQYALTIGGLPHPKNNISFDFADKDDSLHGFWLYWNSSGSNKITAGNSRLQYMDGQWHHVAMVRSKGTITAYMDGVAQGAVYYPGVLGDSEQPVLVGAHIDRNLMWKGCIDELRIINGRALWTSDFNPRFYLPPPINAFR